MRKKINITKMTQAELEGWFVDYGKAKYYKTCEASGVYFNFANNAYVTKVAECIDSLKNSKFACKSLLDQLDSDAIAIVIIRGALKQFINIQAKDRDITRPMLITRLAKYFLAELLFTQYKKNDPGLFHYILTDSKARGSASPEWMMRKMLKAMESKGKTPINIDKKAKWLLGAAFVRILEACDLLKSKLFQARKKKICYMNLTDGFCDQLLALDTVLDLSTPLAAPCKELPKDWVTANDGGFHTFDMRVSHPSIILGKSHHIYDIPFSREILNKAQREAYKIDTSVLESINLLAKEQVNFEELLFSCPVQKPKYADYMDSEDGLKYFNADTQRYYQELQRSITKIIRCKSILEVSNTYAALDKFYFVHQFDFRGRMYTISSDITYQGSDLQCSLIKFAKEEPLGQTGVEDFLDYGCSLHGALDLSMIKEKLTYIDTVDGIIDLIYEADKPFMFLAFCFEYKKLIEFIKAGGNPEEFMTGFIARIDGKCNGLQHISALVMDEIGGAAVNLTTNKAKQDIYMLVAAQVETRLNMLSIHRNYNPHRDYFKDIKDKRKLVKRCVMTTPYGVKSRGMINQVFNDTLKVIYPNADKRELFQAAVWFVDQILKPSIDDVLVGSKLAMKYLKEAARVYMDAKDTDLRWMSPSGFVVETIYRKYEKKRVKSVLLNYPTIDTYDRRESNKLDKYKATEGFVPNFIHSLDAAHFHHIAHIWDKSLCSTHDCFGTHPAHIRELHYLVRDTFVNMYAKNPIFIVADMVDGLENAPELPEFGSLDVSDVYYNDWFFC